MCNCRESLINFDLYIEFVSIIRRHLHIDKIVDLKNLQCCFQLALDQSNYAIKQV